MAKLQLSRAAVRDEVNGVNIAMQLRGRRDLCHATAPGFDPDYLHPGLDAVRDGLRTRNGSIHEYKLFSAKRNLHGLR